MQDKGVAAAAPALKKQKKHTGGEDTLYVTLRHTSSDAVESFHYPNGVDLPFGVLLGDVPWQDASPSTALFGASVNLHPAAPALTDERSFLDPKIVKPFEALVTQLWPKEAPPPDALTMRLLYQTVIRRSTKAWATCAQNGSEKMISTLKRENEAMSSWVDKITTMERQEMKDVLERSLSRFRRKSASSKAPANDPVDEVRNMEEEDDDEDDNVDDELVVIAKQERKQDANEDDEEDVNLADEEQQGDSDPIKWFMSLKAEAMEEGEEDEEEEEEQQDEEEDDDDEVEEEEDDDEEDEDDDDEDENEEK